MARPAPAPVLAIAILLAGCADDAASPAPSATPSTAATPSPAPTEPSPELATPTAAVVHGLDGAPAPRAWPPEAPVVGLSRSTSSNTYEPSIAVTRDGVLLVSAATPTSQPTVLRSLDGGVTWQDVGPVLATGRRGSGLSNLSYLYLDPGTERLFSMDLYPTEVRPGSVAPAWPLGATGSNAPVCGVGSFSDDLGDSWTTNPLFCPHPSVHWFARLVATPDGSGALTPRTFESVIHLCRNDALWMPLVCAESNDGGRTFEEWRVALGTACEPLGHLATDAEGYVYAPLGCDFPVLVVKSPSGAYRGVVVNVTRPVQFFSYHTGVAVDDAGTLYYVWVSDGLPYLSVSRDRGETWSPARVVAPPDVTATDHPVIAAGAEGRVAIAYVGTRIDGGYFGKPIDRGEYGDPTREPVEWADATWNAYVGVILDAAGENATIATATANDPADPIARGVCGLTRCRGMGLSIDLRIDALGRPWAAFVDVCSAACVTDPGVKKDPPVGLVATLASGPSLRGPLAPLPPLGAANGRG